jgi:hypothetical protein
VSGSVAEKLRRNCNTHPHLPDQLGMQQVSTALIASMSMHMPTFSKSKHVSDVCV